MFDEAVTTYEECVEKEGTLNGTGETTMLQLKSTATHLNETIIYKTSLI